MRIPLKYTLLYTNNTVAGVGFQLSLQATNINDPGGAGAATQPYGFDILKLAYNNFVVLGTAIRVTCSVISSGTTSYATSVNDLIVWPSGVSTSFASDAEGAKQQPGAKWLTGNMAGNFMADCFPTIRNYQGTAKQVGRTTQQILADGNYHGGINGTNPVLGWYWNIVVAPPGGVAANANQYVLTLELVMYTEVYGLVSLAST